VRNAKIAQGSARRQARPIQLRWQRSQKLAGYYDPDRHALIYQDASGREVDRVELPAVRSIKLTDRLE
jgi:hypothetical protein